MKITIKDNQRGLLFKKGRFYRLLDAGRHYVWGGDPVVEISDIDQPIFSNSIKTEIFLENKELTRAVTVIDVPDQQIALHFVNDHFLDALPRGCHAFWRDHGVHRFTMIDISEPRADKSITPQIFARIGSYHYEKVQVQAHQKARLYYDGKFVALLDPGTHYFWKNSTKIHTELVDTRLQQMHIQGQEILTLDKVALRINFVCRYRITDFVKISTEIEDYQEQIHVLGQLALREYIGRSRLDDLLENKDQLADFVLSQLKKREDQCFVSFFDAGIKDITLPSEVRELMNTVLLAEKRAQANLITRREEVASTRSLLNTAKLMEENPTLLHLKEMECLEKICENVGNITVGGGGDLLGQLATFLKGGAA